MASEKYLRRVELSKDRERVSEKDVIVANMAILNRPVTVEEISSLTNIEKENVRLFMLNGIKINLINHKDIKDENGKIERYYRLSKQEKFKSMIERRYRKFRGLPYEPFKPKEYNTLRKQDILYYNIYKQNKPVTVRSSMGLVEWGYQSVRDTLKFLAKRGLLKKRYNFKKTTPVTYDLVPINPVSRKMINRVEAFGYGK